MVLRMACLVVILFVGGQVWAEDLVFTLNNKTSLVLDSFFASPTGVGDWEDDILGVDVLGPGESIQINVNDGRRTCKYDVLSTFVDGTKVEESRVDLCSMGSYTIHQ